MYTPHFGLSQDPFSIAPDPRFLFMSERHREALAHLLYGVAGQGGQAGGTGGGFVLLTGDIGTGKTTICRCFLEQIPAGCHVAYIFNPKLSVIELLQSICEEFHLSVPPNPAQATTAKAYIDALNTFLLQSHAAGQSCVLIIDEAQNLAPEVLEQLRLLTNLETNARKLLQIVLIGQPELRTMLANPALEQLAQRVIARFHLDALNASETTQYIEHRLAVAGHSGGVPFDAKALARIHRLARGVPRRINLLCGRALLGAWATGKQRVDAQVVNKAAAEVFGAVDDRRAFWTTPRAVAALGSVAVLAGAALLASRWWPDTPKPPPVAKAVPQVARPSWVASQPMGATLVPGLSALPALEDMVTLWPTLAPDKSVAWRDLAAVWKLPAGVSEPCQDAALAPMQCHQASKLTLPQLRQLDRPGILTLQSGIAAPVYAVLIGLSGQTATLSTSAGVRRVKLAALAALWPGDFATFWQPPPGYTPALSDGNAGPATALLMQHLAQLDGQPLPTAGSAPLVLNADLRARVRAFQRAQGLVPDGQPGPLTFMQLERTIGSSAPHLLTEPR